MINLRDTGAEIGLACGRVLALSSATLVGSLIVSGAVVVAGEFPGFKAPHRVAKMSAILMGASVAGCILGAWMSGGIGKDERKHRCEISDKELTKEWHQKHELAREFSNSEIEMSRSVIDARDNEIRRRGELLRETRRRLNAAQEQVDEWEYWWEICQSLDAKYDVFGCKGCRFFEGSDNSGNFFVCAMHPYGQRNCEDKENE